jgi:hypothetical protein
MSNGAHSGGECGFDMPGLLFVHSVEIRLIGAGGGGDCMPPPSANRRCKGRRINTRQRVSEQQRQDCYMWQTLEAAGP